MGGKSYRAFAGIGALLLAVGIAKSQDFSDDGFYEPGSQVNSRLYRIASDSDSLVAYTLDVDKDGNVDFLALQRGNQIRGEKGRQKNKWDYRELPGLIKSSLRKDKEGYVWCPELYVSRDVNEDEELRESLNRYVSSRWSAKVMSPLQQSLADAREFGRIKEPYVYAFTVDDRGAMLQMNFKPLSEKGKYQPRVDFVVGVDFSGTRDKAKIESGGRETFLEMLNSGTRKVFAYVTPEGEGVMREDKLIKSRVEELTGGLEAVVTSMPLAGPYVRETSGGDENVLLVDLGSKRPWEYLGPRKLEDFKWDLVVLEADSTTSPIDVNRWNRYMEVPLQLLIDIIGSREYSHVYLSTSFSEELDKEVSIPKELKSWILNPDRVEVRNDFNEFLAEIE